MVRDTPFHTKSTQRWCRTGQIALVLGVGCSPSPSAPDPVASQSAKPKVVKQLDKPETPRELRHRLVPGLRIQPDAAPFDAAGLLSLPKELGVAVVPILRRTGQHRQPTKEELSRIAALGEPLALAYRRNLGRMVNEASIRAIGGERSGEARLLDIDTSLPGVEACILLPELWDQARATIGREVWLALPDRGHCQFLPAGPWRVVAEMIDELARRSAHASEPLFDRFLYRSGDTLRGGPTFASMRPKK